MHHAPNIPVILVGTKLDLREDEETLRRLQERSISPVTYQQGMQLAREIKATRYWSRSS